MNQNIRRTHDKYIYMEEERYEQPKEISKILLDLILKTGVLQPGCTVNDIGCAAGEYLYFMHQQYPEAHYKGFDVVPELLNKAKERVPSGDFDVGSILDEGIISESSSDITILSGVHPIFDDIEPKIKNLISWTRPGGLVYMSGSFNPYPVDVWIKYRRSDDPDREHLEPGWNQFSKITVSKLVDKFIGVGKHTFTAFEMPFDLPPHADDPVRTWTFLDSDGRRYTMNGLSLIANREILEIRV